ncbi:glycosyltransferase family 2 protein [Asticcacaulis solisilvae]|uniref:glycosyltransferase family 2 protein n=1 Tax=Asticcacaulis solisilvae TaxID=1217274 RepID=UPI003FD7191A
MKPSVSVIIPAYNAEAFVAATLKSAQAQTLRDIEILVVDDGSTDTTADIVRAFAEADNRIRLITKPNGGVGSARNRGLAEAGADFVAFLDADDLWHPEKLETQLDALKQSGDAAAFSLHVGIDRDGRFLAPSTRWPFETFPLPAHMVLRPVGNGSSVMVRRDVALAAGGFDEDFVKQGLGGCEDLDFELRVAASHPIRCVPHFHVGYRVYDGNMSSDKGRMARALTAVVDLHLKRNPGLSDFCRRMARLKSCEYTVWLMREEPLDKAFAQWRQMAAIDGGYAVGYAGRTLLRNIWRGGRSLIRGRAVRNALPFDEIDPETVASPVDKRGTRALYRRLVG